MKILVPLDGSTFAESAIPAANALAEALDASIEFVSVLEDQSIVMSSDATAQQFREWLTQYLENLLQRMADLSNAEMTFSIVEGSPAVRLVEHARQSAVDLVIMSTHGRGVLSRAWLGSVADHVLRNVDVPVLLIRADESESPDLGAQRSLRRIAVALDGSDLAERSLDWAVRIAKSTNASLTLLRVVEPPTPFSSPYLPHAVSDTRTSIELGEKQAEQYLLDVAERLEGQGVVTESETLPGWHPAQGILDFSTNNPVDLIVIATHGRSGVARVVLGSVADKVVRGAQAPVLLIRPPAEHRHDRSAAATSRKHSKAI